MANPKTTQKEYFEQIIALAKANDRNDLAEFAQSRIALLEKKASAKKPNKVQKENEGYKATILDILTDVTLENGMTATDILKASDEFKDFSTPKISALLKQLVDTKQISKEVVKGKSLFFGLDEDDTEDDIQALDRELSI